MIIVVACLLFKTMANICRERRRVDKYDDRDRYRYNEDRDRYQDREEKGGDRMISERKRKLDDEPPREVSSHSSSVNATELRTTSLPPKSLKAQAEAERQERLALVKRLTRGFSTTT